MDNNNTQTKKSRGITVSIIIIIIIIALIAFAMPKKGVAPQAPVDTTTTTDATGTKMVGTTGTKSGVTSTSGALSYTDALAKYQDRMVRITDDCKADKVTATLSLPVGQQVMVANDSKTKSHAVVIDGTTYTLASQHYKIMTIKNMGLVSSTCDPKTGVTTVAVAPAQ